MGARLYRLLAGPLTKEASITELAAETVHWTSFGDELQKLGADRQEPSTTDDAVTGVGALAGGGVLAKMSVPRVTGRQALYHGTTAESAARIREQGLLPSNRGGAAGVINKGNFPKEWADKAYVTTSKNLKAPMYAAQAAKLRPGEGGAATVKMSVPTWKIPLQENPETAGGFHAWRQRTLDRLKGAHFLDFNAHQQAALIRDNELAARAQHGLQSYAEHAVDSIPTEYIKGSKNYRGVGLREIAEYARARPGRFAGGAALATGAAALGGYGVKKLWDAVHPAVPQAPPKTAGIFHDRQNHGKKIAGWTPVERGIVGGMVGLALAKGLWGHARRAQKSSGVLSSLEKVAISEEAKQRASALNRLGFSQNSSKTAANVLSSLEGLVATPLRARIAGGLGFGLAGAGAGAALDKKNRTRGALAGGLLGGVLGAAVTPAALARTKWAEPGDTFLLGQALDNEGPGIYFKNGRKAAGPEVEEAISSASVSAGASPAYSSTEQGARRFPRVRVRQRGRHMYAEVIPDELDVVGRAAPVVVTQKARFGQSSEEFARQAHAHAARVVPERSFGVLQKTAGKSNLAEVPVGSAVLSSLEKVAISEEAKQRAIAARYDRLQRGAADALKASSPEEALRQGAAVKRLAFRTEHQIHNVLQNPGKAPTVPWVGVERPPRPVVDPVAAQRSKDLAARIPHFDAQGRARIVTPPPPAAEAATANTALAVRNTAAHADGGVGSALRSGLNRVGGFVAGNKGKILLGAGALTGGIALKAYASKQQTPIPTQRPPAPTLQVASSPWAKQGSVKLAAELPGVGDEGERPRVPGMKQPRLAAPRLNPDQGKHIPINPFRGNWQKLAGSRLRRSVQVVSKAHEYLPGLVDHTMHLNGRPIGYMETLNGRIVGTHINDEFQGFGLGKKLYGEVMRRLPNQELKSGEQVSEAAQRVWGSLGKTQGYTIDKVPGVVKTYGNRTALEAVPGREGQPLFTGKLPLAAAIKQANLYDILHYAFASPEALAATAGIAKAHLLGRYGTKIPGLKQVFRPYYEGAAHAGLVAGTRGERGLHPVSKGILSAFDPHVVGHYEQAQALGAAARERGIHGLPSVDDVRQSVGVLKAHGVQVPMGLAEHSEYAVDPTRPANRIARALTKPIEFPKLSRPVQAGAAPAATGVVKAAGAEDILRELGTHWNAIPEKVRYGALGTGAVGLGLATLKRTADQAVNPRPEGVGLGAGARTAQKVLSLGLSRSGSEPVYY